MRHKTKSRRALLFPRVPGGGVYSVLLYAARYVFAVVAIEEYSGLTIVAHTQFISAGAVLFRHRFLGFQIELCRAVVDSRLPPLCDQFFPFELFEQQRFLGIRFAEDAGDVLRLDNYPFGAVVLDGELRPVGQLLDYAVAQAAAQKRRCTDKGA